MRLAVLTDSRLVVNLPRNSARLRQDAAAGLGIGIGVLRFTFVEETHTQGIHRNAERIIVAALRIALPVRVLWRFEVRRFGVDGGHMSALPLASGCRAQS